MNTFDCINYIEFAFDESHKMKNRIDLKKYRTIGIIMRFINETTKRLPQKCRDFQNKAVIFTGTIYWQIGERFTPPLKRGFW